MLVGEIISIMTEDQWVEITGLINGDFWAYGMYYADEVPPDLLEMNVLAIEMGTADNMPNRYDNDLGEEMYLELYVDGNEEDLEDACT